MKKTITLILSLVAAILGVQYYAQDKLTLGEMISRGIKNSMSSGGFPSHNKKRKNNTKEPIYNDDKTTNDNERETDEQE